MEKPQRQVPQSIFCVVGAALLMSCSATGIDDLPDDLDLAPNAKADSDGVAYEKLDGCVKQQYLWHKRILPTEYPDYPSIAGISGWATLLNNVRTFFSLGTSFTHVSDEMPRFRSKFIHPLGSVAKIEYQAAAGSPYPGLLSEASVCGLARASLAADPTLVGYTPGLAVKLFIDGTPSANIHVMNSLNGQGANNNYFDRYFTNILPPPRGLMLNALAGWFKTAVPDPTRLRLHHLVAFNADGSKTNSRRAPYQIYFVPAAGRRIDPGTNKDLREELARIPHGAVLYQVYAAEHPTDSHARRIGRIVTRSRFIASGWGDTGLFFRHQR